MFKEMQKNKSIGSRILETDKLVLENSSVKLGATKS